MTATLGPSEPLPAGHRLGEFEISGTLGRGLHGTIYAARDTALGRKVALKLGPGGADRWGGDAYGRLKREASLLSRFRHEGIPKVLRFVTVDGHDCLVMEYEEGTPLEEVLSGGEGTIAEADLVAIVSSVLDALGPIHEAGYLHRDVKPANILIRTDGSPMLMDLGAASPVGQPEETTELTPGYAAPEQFVSGGHEGPWTDLYGLAAVAYRMIGGRVPDVRERSRADTLVPAVTLGAGSYPKAVLRAIDQALQLDPAARPQSAREWREALTGHAGGDMGRVSEGYSAPVRAESSSEDDYPPTVRIKRLPALAPGSPSSDQPAASKPATQHTLARRIAAGGLVVVLAFAILIAAMLWDQVSFWQVKDQWIVDASGLGDTISIADAMERAPAGAQIVIRPGLYHERLVMDRELHLVAADDSAAEVVVATPSGTCLRATSKAGSVRGLSFRLDGAGLAGFDDAPCLDLVASNILVENNVIRNRPGVAVLVREGADPTVRRNVIADTGGVGIVVETGARGTISENEIKRSAESGIKVHGGAAPTIEQNRIESSGQAGILYDSGGGGILRDNEILASAASGVEVRGGADPEVSGNRIVEGAQAGIYVYEGGRGTFIANVVSRNGYSGVIVDGGADPTLDENRIAENGEHGIFVLDGGKGTFRRNAVEGNQGHGIAISERAASTLDANELLDNREPQTLTGQMTEP